ncbi:MAG: aminoglycoside phosphotransferase family protein [Pseudomonadota bacterium]
MDDRIRIAPETVAALVKAQFPQWSRLPVKPVTPGGWDNLSFRLGDDLLVRIPSAPRYAAQVAIEQTWLPRIAPVLPVAIPEPVALGQPTDEIPFAWSVYRWLPGETVLDARPDETALARDLATALRAFWKTETSDGPMPGARNFHRGGDLGVYQVEVINALSTLPDPCMRDRALAIWQEAMSSPCRATPVWVHGDVAPGNLLVSDGRLSAVIDFGLLAVGDPACDLSIAYSWFGAEARSVFQKTMDLDRGIWSRAVGWALWKALIIRAKAGLSVAEREASARVLRALDIV